MLQKRAEIRKAPDLIIDKVHVVFSILWYLWERQSPALARVRANRNALSSSEHAWIFSSFLLRGGSNVQYPTNTYSSPDMALPACPTMTSEKEEPIYRKTAGNDTIYI